MPLVLDNLRSAVKVLSDLLAVTENKTRMAQFSQVERDGIRAGVIQSFEVTYELCWKLIARWLKANVGTSVVDGVTRRELFRRAAQQRLIADVIGGCGITRRGTSPPTSTMPVRQRWHTAPPPSSCTTHATSWRHWKHAMIDLAPHHLESVRRILAEHVPDCEVRAFGSRAKWEGWDYSDLDLAVLCGDGEDRRAIARLKAAFEESDLPIRVDVLDWHALADDFRDIIESDHVVVQQVPEHANWELVRLGSCTVINDLTYSPMEAWPFINYLDTGNITENRIDNIQHLLVGQDKIPTRARRRVQSGDIVYSMVRPNQRHYGLLKDTPDNLIVSTGFAVMRGQPDIADTDFIYWSLSQNRIVEHLQAVAEHSTSAYPSIRPDDLASLEFSLPPIEEQRAIAGVLGALDDKIELNRRMSETLEEMARALFRSWFVDFDPVRAKAEGRPSGLPPDLDTLFPDSFEESELGEIPAGWHIRMLGELCDQPQYGYTRAATDEPIGPKFLRIADINKNSWIEWETVPYCEVSSDHLAKYRLREGDILIARIADPGHSCMIEEEREAVFASYLIRFRPTLEILERFLQCWLRSDSYWNLVTARATGTTRVNLNAKVLSEFPVLLPPKSLLEVFGEHVGSLRSRVVANTAESATLSAQRDALLPRLMSGELRLDGVERSMRNLA